MPNDLVIPVTTVTRRKAGTSRYSTMTGIPNTKSTANISNGPVTTVILSITGFQKMAGNRANVIAVIVKTMYTTKPMARSARIVIAPKDGISRHLIMTKKPISHLEASMKNLNVKLVMHLTLKPRKSTPLVIAAISWMMPIRRNRVKAASYATTRSPGNTRFALTMT